MIRTSIIALAVLSAASIIGFPASAGENLGTNLRKTGWDRMIGAWVDAETKGKKLKIETVWRFKDQVLETTTEDLQEKKKSLSLMGFNPKRAEVFHVGMDEKGGSSLGKWTLKKDEATLDLGYVTPEKQEGLLQLRYKLVDNDTLEITFVLPEPITIKLVRLQEKGHQL